MASAPSGSPGRRTERGFRVPHSQTKRTFRWFIAAGTGISVVSLAMLRAMAAQSWSLEVRCLGLRLPERLRPTSPPQYTHLPQSPSQMRRSILYITSPTGQRGSSPFILRQRQEPARISHCVFAWLTLPLANLLKTPLFTSRSTLVRSQEQRASLEQHSRPYSSRICPYCKFYFRHGPGN
jgi:hypothetical protein